jgi:hypothetical protein
MWSMWGGFGKTQSRVREWSSEHKRVASGLFVTVVGGLALAGLVQDSSSGPVIHNSNTQEVHLPPPPQPSEPQPSPEPVEGAPFVGPRSGNGTDLCLFAEAATFDFTTDRYSAFKDTVDLNPGNVASWVVTVFNMENAPDGGVLTNLALTITVPKGRRKLMSINVAASGDNLNPPRNGYAHADTVVLKSKKPFTVKAVSGFQVMRDEARKPEQDFLPGRAQEISTSAYKVSETPTETTYTVRPLPDGSLGPSHHEDFRFMMYVYTK